MHLFPMLCLQSPIFIIILDSFNLCKRLNNISIDISDENMALHFDYFSIALMVAAYVRGTDEKTRMQRRNIVRYCVLSQALVFRDISMRVRKRFPTMDTLVAAGFFLVSTLLFCI